MRSRLPYWVREGEGAGCKGRREGVCRGVYASSVGTVLVVVGAGVAVVYDGGCDALAVVSVLSPFIHPSTTRHHYPHLQTTHYHLPIRSLAPLPQFHILSTTSTTRTIHQYLLTTNTYLLHLSTHSPPLIPHPTPLLTSLAPTHSPPHTPPTLSRPPSLPTPLPSYPLSPPLTPHPDCRRQAAAPGRVERSTGRVSRAIQRPRRSAECEDGENGGGQMGTAAHRRRRSSTGRRRGRWTCRGGGRWGERW